MSDGPAATELLVVVVRVFTFVTAAGMAIVVADGAMSSMPQFEGIIGLAAASLTFALLFIGLRGGTPVR